jgi:predicted Zn finger-like uncharacterized protein
MLITTCAHCGARFRVTPLQLNAKQGQVRCGRCQKVFSGFEALERFPDDDTGGRLLAAREAAERAASNLTPVDPVSFEELPDIETLQPSDEGLPESQPPSSPAPLSAAPEPSHAANEPDATPSAPAQGAPRARDKPSPEITLPEIPRPRPPARAWGFGAALLALVLATELAYAFRGSIAQRYPVLRPYLESACGTMGCTVSWAHDDALLKLEDSELLEVPGKPNEIALNARIRNLAAVAQEYPYVELTLTDISGQAAIRRVLRPTDYLGRPVTGAETIAPGAELAIQLRLETPRIKATGYELLLFYP